MSEESEAPVCDQCQGRGWITPDDADRAIAKSWDFFNNGYDHAKRWCLPSDLGGLIARLEKSAHVVRVLADTTDDASEEHVQISKATYEAWAAIMHEALSVLRAIQQEREKS